MSRYPAWIVVAVALLALAQPAQTVAAESLVPGVGSLPWAAAAGRDNPPAADRRLRSTLGAGYAGSWLERGRLVVGITDRTRGAAARSLGARPLLVEHSAAELERLKLALDRRWRTPPDEAAQWGVDTVANALVIFVVGPGTPTQVRAEAARSDAVRIEHVARAPRRLWDIIGGQRIVLADGDCSVGFNARAGTARYVLTAGHCAEAGAGAGGVGGSMGVVANASFPTNDYARIQVTSSSAEQTPFVDRYARGTDVSVVGSNVTPIGGRICKSGITTQWTCGLVTAFDQTVVYQGDIVRGMTATTLCALPGDSGGSVVSDPGPGRQVDAQGLISGGNSTCGAGAQTFFQPIGEVHDAYGVNLVTVPRDPVPVAADDAYATNEDSALTVAAPGVLGNDSDPTGQPLTAVGAAHPTHGTLDLNADGSFSYVPDADFSGTDSFAYQANDGFGNSNIATVTITVTEVASPFAANDTGTTREDQAVSRPAPGVLGNDTDPGGGALTAALVSGPAHGSLTLNADGSFTYTPAINFYGVDSFTYTASNGSLESNTATVTMIVTPVNDRPVAADDSYATSEDRPDSRPAPGVLANDTDADGDALSAWLVSGPSHGTLALNADGSFTYTPAPDFYGTDSFAYEVNDGSPLESNAATVTLFVIPVHDRPVAGDDSYATAEDTPLTVAAPAVLGNDTDADGQELRAILVSGPAHGTLTLNLNGSFTYTPAADYHGADSFAYKVNDGTSLESNTATVTISVNPVNDRPTAAGDTYGTDEDTPLSVPAPGVLGNDSDLDGDDLDAVLVSGPAHGTLTLNANGSFVYSPAPNYNGADAFTYRADDGSLSSDPATVTITVAPVAEPIVFASSRTGNGDIYAVEPGGDALVQLTSGPGIDVEPAWSPDGTKIAFTSTRDGNAEIYVMGAGGGNVTRLTTNAAVDASPAWSPDGSRIAFASNRTKKNLDVYTLAAADGSGVTRLTTHNADDTLPAWSPDGTRIAFASARTGGGDVYAMNANGTGVTRLTTSSAVDSEPAWSTAAIAFATNRDGSGNYEIYRMNPNGSAQSRLTNQTGNDISPAWSPDGTQLAFATSRHGVSNFEIYVMNANGSAQTRVTTNPAQDALPDW